MNGQRQLPPQPADLGYQLDQLAARAIRAAADLRRQSRSILEDLNACRCDLEQVGQPDTGACPPDAGDLAKAAARLHLQTDDIRRRLTEAQSEAAHAWRAVRDGINTSLRDACRVFEPTTCGDTRS